ETRSMPTSRTTNEGGADHATLAIPRGAPSNWPVLHDWRGRSEPRHERLSRFRVREVSGPGDVSIGSDEHRRGGGGVAEDGELPGAVVPGVDDPDAVRPR